MQGLNVTEPLGTLRSLSRVIGGLTKPQHLQIAITFSLFPFSVKLWTFMGKFSKRTAEGKVHRILKKVRRLFIVQEPRNHLSFLLFGGL